MLLFDALTWSPTCGSDVLPRLTALLSLWPCALPPLAPNSSVAAEGGFLCQARSFQV